MYTENWVALLAICHRFRFTEAEFRAQREVFQCHPPLDPVKQIAIADVCRRGRVETGCKQHREVGVAYEGRINNCVTSASGIILLWSALVN